MEEWEGMTDRYDGRLISADSHIVEPRDLWTSRIDARFRGRAPKIATLDETGDYIVIDGLRPRPLAFEGPMIEARAQGVEIAKPKGYRVEQNRLGAWDPDARLGDQDLDGVSGEVIYPGVGLHIGRAPDGEYIYASCRAYNDWLAEFCAAHPARLKGAAMLPNRGPVEWAVTEAERAAKLGLTTTMLPSFCDDRPYNLPEWDTLWAALQDLGLVAGMHLCGREPYGIAHGPGAGGINVGIIKFAMYDTLMRIIWGGAPVRFPKLKWCLVEGGIGWIGAVLEFMDHWWNEHKAWMAPRLPETPSTYFHRQFFATFENDRSGVLTREITGVDNLMWGSDYPHTEGVWPFSRRQVARNFASIPALDTRKMVHDNAVRVFGFPEA
jgi:predicted TIM-barrel fold metal-dependent hydrolase